MATIKHSRQREQIIEFLKGRKDHPTADVVYQNVRMGNPSISLGTVYRNLTLLSELGEIQRLCPGDGTNHFDADITPHYHFVCNKCGAVIDLVMKTPKNLEQMAAAGFEGKIDGHVTYFYGTCKSCTEES